jgi:hypothetical protein
VGLMRLPSKKGFAIPPHCLSFDDAGALQFWCRFRFWIYMVHHCLWVCKGLFHRHLIHCVDPRSKRVIWDSNIVLVYEWKMPAQYLGVIQT